MSTCIYEVSGVYLSAMGVLSKNVRLKDARLVQQDEIASLNFEQLLAIDARDAKDLHTEWSLAQANTLFHKES